MVTTVYAFPYIFSYVYIYIYVCVHMYRGARGSGRGSGVIKWNQWGTAMKLVEQWGTCFKRASTLGGTLSAFGGTIMAALNVSFCLTKDINVCDAGHKACINERAARRSMTQLHAV